MRAGPYCESLPGILKVKSYIKIYLHIIPDAYNSLHSAAVCTILCRLNKDGRNLRRTPERGEPF